VLGARQFFFSRFCQFTHELSSLKLVAFIVMRTSQTPDPSASLRASACFARLRLTASAALRLVRSGAAVSA